VSITAYHSGRHHHAPSERVRKRSACSSLMRFHARFGSAPGTIIERAMTAKEQLLQEAPGWSEHDAEIALRAVRRKHASGNGDEWGELSKVHEVAFGETMKRLAEEERAAGHEPWRDTARSGGRSIQSGGVGPPW
jgi:hypothetical protein